MREMTNKCTIEGRIYQHKLVVKQVSNQNSANYGKDFISGSIDIATDDNCMNVVTVYYTYVAPTFSNGKANSTYDALNKIIESGKTVMADKKENATMVRLTPSLSLNEFYTTDRVSGEEKLVSSKRCEGGFVSFIDKLNPDENKRTKFDVDMLIRNVRMVDADEDKNIPEAYDVLEGYIFNFRKEILPVEFVVRGDKPMKYFESLGIDNQNPIFTRLWGQITSKVVKTQRVIAGALGDEVKEYENTFKEFLVVNLNPNPYVLDADSSDLKPEEVKKALADMEIRHQDIKKRKEEWEAQKAAAPASNTTSNGIDFDSFLN